MNNMIKLAPSAPDPKTLFKDLGRPTLRGVRKCPRCGVYNGIRGLSCKNKDCNMVLRGKGRKSSNSVEAIRIITGSSAMIYSVPVRDRGPDYRGFVELLLSSEITIAGPDPEPVTLTQASHCYVESCQKGVSVDGSNICQHIQLAHKCTAEAQPLTLKNSVLNSLPVSNEMKQAIWLLATETTGPLVQRVSKNIMVVKCKAQAKHQLGFLHFSFSETSKKKGTVERKFHCTCRQFRNFKHLAEENKKRCVHFYACICAFASDESLAKEFAYFINLDNAGQDSVPQAQPAVQITIIDGQMSGSTQEVVPLSSPSPSKKRRKDDTLAQASSALLTLQDGTSSPVKKTPPAKRGGSLSSQAMDQSIGKDGISSTPHRVAGPTVSFTRWLGSVTERINQTMHYQFEGCPEPLVFHIPQVFFDVLQQRISSGSRKKRLPNSTVAFVRKDALPLGTFTKYTWQLTSIIHVKQIFDTPEMPLELTRSFVENKNGTFSQYVSPKVDVEHVGEAYRRVAGQVPIKPFELKTFLKVGNTAADQKEPTPFIIEWIPDILPKSRIGELRIKFEYGHQRNGHVERRIEEPQTAIEQVVMS
ncbi:uncharacterized protein C2orf42-like [Diadema antillarum]|uniref:uncharacterized protein C2orf42-like n=2 Tax=Diadema antillarum TaxID=105358 RepID=UPI003A8A40D3